MIKDLDETLKQLLIQKGGLEPASVDIRFDAPSRDLTAAPTRPVINLFLYDIHENVELREMRWDTQREGIRKVKVKRPPLQIDLSYSVTCWSNIAEDQHQLLWRALQTLGANSPLPKDLLQGDLKNQDHWIQTKVAQPDSVLKNPADLWSALKTEPAPSINLVVTLELDLEVETITPLVFARVLRTGLLETRAQMAIAKDEQRPDRMGWETSPLRFGGIVHYPTGQPVKGASVRLLKRQTDGNPVQLGPTIQSDESGHYVFAGVPASQYTLVVELPGQAPLQRTITVGTGERGEPLPELVNDVEVPMAQT